MARRSYGYYIVVDGKVIDLNDHDVYMLTDDEVNDLEEIHSDYMDEIAQQMHKSNLQESIESTTHRNK